MPEEPHDMKKRMKNFTNRKVPHFFVYAKDKEECQVEDSTTSLVDKFESLIPSPNITIRYLEGDKAQRLGKPDYRFLMNKPFADTDANEHLVVSKYCELLKTYSHKINAITDNCTLSAEILVKSKIKQQVMYQRIINEVMSELSAFGYSDVEITDILVRYLYCNKYGSDRKDLLWLCYGDIILRNMKLNKSNFDYLKDTQCVDCGEWFYVWKLTRNVCRCNECLIEHNREKRRIKIARYRQNKAERMCIPS